VNSSILEDFVIMADLLALILLISMIVGFLIIAAEEFS
jgi:hypothetical protein